MKENKNNPFSMYDHCSRMDYEFFVALCSKKSYSKFLNASMKLLTNSKNTCGGDFDAKIASKSHLACTFLRINCNQRTSKGGGEGGDK